MPKTNKQEITKQLNKPTTSLSYEVKVSKKTTQKIISSTDLEAEIRGLLKDHISKDDYQDTLTKISKYWDVSINGVRFKRI